MSSAVPTGEKLILESVGYRYSAGTPFEVRALDNVSVSFRSGRITGIIGHTGSGKSTLLRLLNGLEKPETGRVLLDGDDIWREPKKIGGIRFRVGLVMQYPEYQLFEETVAKDISYGPGKMGLSEEEISARVAEAMNTVSLPESMADSSPFDLSGGQKRRVAIAGVMAMKPEVLVLDEPAAGLDPEGRRTVFGAIDRYRRENGATVIVVSHSLEDMGGFCDDLVILKEGRVVASGEKEAIFSDPSLLEKAGLDLPEMMKLFSILSERGLAVGKGIYTVEAAADELCRVLGPGEGR